MPVGQVSFLWKSIRTLVEHGMAFPGILLCRGDSSRRRRKPLMPGVAIATNRIQPSPESWHGRYSEELMQTVGWGVDPAQRFFYRAICPSR